MLTLRKSDHGLRYRQPATSKWSTSGPAPRATLPLGSLPRGRRPWPSSRPGRGKVWN